LEVAAEAPNPVVVEMVALVVIELKPQMLE
jgi:hypothetical protein